MKNDDNRLLEKLFVLFIKILSYMQSMTTKF